MNATAAATERFEKARRSWAVAKYGPKKARMAVAKEYTAAWVEMTGHVEATSLQTGDSTMSTMTTTNGRTFESPFTSDKEAAQALLLSGKASSFGHSLIRQFSERGRLSAAQAPYLHLMAMEAQGVEKAPDAQGNEAEGGFQAIVDLLTTAGAKLKWPKIRYAGLRISLSRNGGANVTTNERAYEDRTYLGRISQGGAFFPARGCPDTVLPLLQALTVDPAHATSVEGQRVGSCCFCARELTAQESLVAGYGPVCADNWGLPWGDR